jgi:tyrosyl-tRNA synthetase
MLTFLPVEEIDKMNDWEGSQLNEAKDILAYELTKLVHGEEEAEKARTASKQLFGGGGNAADMPTVELTADDMTDSAIDILSLLVKGGLCASRSEARRAVEQGGVTAADEKVTDIKKVYSVDELSGEGMVVRRGKKTYKKVVLK